MTKNFILLARDYARTAAVAFAVTVPLTQPASALDRLLMLGGVSLRPYLENTCTEVDKIDDVAVLEARRQRVLRLQAEAASEVKTRADLAVQAIHLWGIAPDAHRAEAKEEMDKAAASLVAAKQNETLINQQTPVLLRCIAQRNAELTDVTAGMSTGGDAAGGVVAATCGSPGGGVVISTSVNTPCSLDVGALVGALFGGNPADSLNDMRVETQPSQGKVDWSNGILTYTPAPDFRGRDSFTMSATHNIAIEGKLVNARRMDLVYVIEVQ